MGAGCKTGKQRYRTAKAAKVVLVGLRARRAMGYGQNRREDRIYLCLLCTGWHLTSEPYKRKKGAA